MWLKAKCFREAEFVVGGFIPEGRAGVASLLVGQFDDESRLIFAGAVGTAVKAAPRDLPAVLHAIAQKEQVFARTRQKMDRTSRWVEPRLVASVRYLDWTADGLLREPVLRGVRPA